MLDVTARDVLGPNGLIAAQLPTYESREPQLEMAAAVEHALAERLHLIVEAGTGTGKSFAYLVPAILAVARAHADPDAASDRSRNNARVAPRIVISTHTISLQEQLMQRDIPFLRSILPYEFAAVLVKGRSNYLSLRRLRGAVERSGHLFSRGDELDQLQQTVDWAKNTIDGSLATLPFKPLPNVWDEVASEHGNCLGKKCPTYDDCFYYKARKRVWGADLLVVNHALFFSDLALRRAGASLLPDYDVVVFDEAHTLEQVASDHLGVSVSTAQVDYLMNRLYHDRTQKGLLLRDPHRDTRELQRLVDQVRYFTHDLAYNLQEWQRRMSPPNGRVKAPPEITNPVSPALMELAGRLTQLADDLPDEKEQIEFNAGADQCRFVATSLNIWMQQEAEDSVYWTENFGRQSQNLRMQSSPVNVAETLREEMFQKIPSVILTSATLAIGNNDFGFVRDRLGLTRSGTLKVGSPFNYREQVELILPQGMPDPAQTEAYESAVCDWTKHYLARTNGRAFVLFTSYKMLKACVQRLTHWINQRGFGLYVQGLDLSRSLMLEKFRADPAGVLFGTDSFWQGVDVPGDALQNVIITKLPFSVPDQPLLEARVESIRARGGNPFQEYQIPEAVIKLKQGFGRLIRTKTDTGIVVILDPRVRTKPYGRIFLDSLPQCRVTLDHGTNAD